MLNLLRLLARPFTTLCILLLFPFSGSCYVQGDINSDDRIGLEETIFSLKVLSGTATAVSGNTINVPGDIPTIQQAIDAASDGDTISIAVGTFTESLKITDKYLILTGAGSGSTIIDGGGADNVIKTINGAANLNNMTIQNGVRGIHITDRSYFETHGLIVKNCSYRGLQIDLNSNGHIFDSSFNNNGHDGISVQRSSNLLISGTVATNSNANNGLHLFQGGTVLFDSAAFTSSDNSNFGIGVHYGSTLYSYATTITIESNIEGLQLSSHSSVGFNSTTMTILDSQQDAIGVYNTSSFNIYGGSITIQRVTQGSGLSVGDSSTVNGDGDFMITDTSASGLSIGNASSVYIKQKFEVLRSGENGIYVGKSSALSNNDTATIKIANTTQYEGIGIAENSIWRANGGNITIQNNTNGAGIIITRNSTVALRNKGTGLSCLISGNSRGIEMSQSSVLRAEKGLTVSSNLGSGVESYRNGDIDLREAVITNNGNIGINADSDTVLQLSNATVSGNTNGNVQLSFGSSSSIYGPTLPATNLICDATVISRGDKVCP